MGIKDLLKFLSTVTIEKQKHISLYNGKTVGIDAYIWLHAGKNSINIAEILTDYEKIKKIDNEIIQYCIQRLELLLLYNIKPYFVFDGANLPAKEKTEHERKEARKNAFETAKKLVEKNNLSDAIGIYIAYIDISPQLAYSFIKILQEKEIPFTVAPYEANIQLAYLANEKIIDIIISDDSNMIAHNVPCTFFKMDSFGIGNEIKSEDIYKCTDPLFTTFSKNMFLWMCILSGCDYVQKIPRFSIEKAYILVYNKRKELSILRELIYDCEISIDYILLLAKAKLTFLHQCVWDPENEKIIYATPLPLKEYGLPEEWNIPSNAPKWLHFLGPPMKETINAIDICKKAIIDPCTLKAYIDSNVQEGTTTKVSTTKVATTKVATKSIPIDTTIKEEKICTSSTLNISSGDNYTSQEVATTLFQLAFGRKCSKFLLQFLHDLDTKLSVLKQIVNKSISSVEANTIINTTILTGISTSARNVLNVTDDEKSHVSSSSNISSSKTIQVSSRQATSTSTIMNVNVSGQEEEKEESIESEKKIFKTTCKIFK